MAGLTSGAGGTSISANLDWAPIVPWNSPAISLVQDAVGRVCHSEQPQVELENLRIELLRLFAQRKAHPKEMDEDGVSLFSVRVQHSISEIFTYTILDCDPVVQTRRLYRNETFIAM